MIVARLTTVNGSCTIPGYDNPEDRWFVCESVSFGFAQEQSDKKDKKKPNESSNELVVGKREETTISISKQIDAASVDLMYQAMSDRFVAKGKQDSTPIKADIHFIETLAHDMVEDKKIKSGVIAFLRIAMETVKVKSWNINASGDGKPTEDIVLWCEQLAMRFQRSTDGRLYKDAGMKGWNQKLGVDGNRAWLPDVNKFFKSKYYPD